MRERIVTSVWFGIIGSFRPNYAGFLCLQREGLHRIGTNEGSRVCAIWSPQAAFSARGVFLTNAAS